ncbi:MAG: hypothetical protein JNK72_15770 [Myxococcales bacterium]|nr:hypothetical protein [Myxococcales bacterium]
MFVYASALSAQHTGGSFGGSAWGSGASSAPSRPARTKIFPTKNTGYGSRYDYDRQRYGANDGGGGGSCAASMATLMLGLSVGLGMVISQRRRR